ncbi:cell wall hydrolase [Bradyrhizobium sp. dw_78]|uniref:cell wall hydrolase n=1 Tax=Bradyrhizobium sp. dw_78 TaxID=2719793 RepID=UPI001BD3422F|nr:cell wall hydrolase [Bradyrhizobium sp. dw_78]
MPNDISEGDLDLIARTMIGEEATPEGRAAVGHVILNRVKSGDYPGSVAAVVSQPNAFESWSARGPQLSRISRNSPDYQTAYQIARGITAGDIPDPTSGSVNFLNPSLQVSLGRKIPAWAQGEPTAVIDKQAYFGGRKMASDDFLSDFEVAAPKPGSKPIKAAPAPSADDATDFEKDFEVAPRGGPPIRVYIRKDDPIGVNDTARAVATGVPIVGGLLNKADAATNALLAPVLNPLFAKENQLQGETWSDRYRNALLQQEGMDTNFASQHPVANTALNIAGGVAGTAPLVMAAPAAFGISRAGLLPNALLSGATGAGLNATDSAIRSGGDIDATKAGAITGGVFGALAPVGGKIVGAGIDKLSDVLTHTTPAARNVSNVLSDIGMTPNQARNALSSMGPYATLADLDPALTTEAGGLASMGGQPTSILKGAMRDRAARVDNRVSDLMERQLGPAPDAEATLSGIEHDASVRASPFYNAGRGGPAMDVTPVLANIEQQLPNASGGIRSLLNSVRGFLTNDMASRANPVGMVVPKSDPAAILGARQALDDIMFNRETGEAKLGPNAMRVAGDLRAQIDGIVKANPSFAQGDAIYSRAHDIQRAFRQGQDIFGSNVRPADLARILSRLSPEEAQALRLGARSSIADVMQSSRRGEGPAAQGLLGRSTNNRANLNLLFPNGQEALDALHAEAMMRGTEQRVAQNSATAERTAVQKKYMPSSEPGVGAAIPIVGEAVGGGPGAMAALAGRAAYGAAKNALTTNALNRLTEGTARGLVATGAEQREFLRQVERAGRTNALVSNLSRRGDTVTNVLTRTLGQKGYNSLSSP